MILLVNLLFSNAIHRSESKLKNLVSCFNVYTVSSSNIKSVAGNPFNALSKAFNILFLYRYAIVFTSVGLALNKTGIKKQLHLSMKNRWLDFDDLLRHTAHALNRLVDYVLNFAETDNSFEPAVYL